MRFGHLGGVMASHRVDASTQSDQSFPPEDTLDH